MCQENCPWAGDPLDENGRRRGSSHPLHHAAVAAAYRARYGLLELQSFHDCHDPDECDVCTSADLIDGTVEFYERILECDLLFSADDCPTEAQRDASHGRRSALHRAGRLAVPRKGHNHPAHEAAVLGLYDLRDALDALVEGHPCDWCGACRDAVAASYAVGLFVEDLAGGMVPTAATLRRDPDVARVYDLLDALEETERADALAPDDDDDAEGIEPDYIAA